MAVMQKQIAKNQETLVKMGMRIDSNQEELIKMGKRFDSNQEEIKATRLKNDIKHDVLLKEILSLSKRVNALEDLP